MASYSHSTIRMAQQQELYEFIINSFDEYDLERMKDQESLPTDVDFSTLEKFRQHQHAVISGLSPENLAHLGWLKNMLGNVSIMDKESMVPLSSDGFYFQGQRLVLTSAR